MKYASIIQWYGGKGGRSTKAQSAIKDVTIPTLLRCEELGGWEQGVKRSTLAQLSKATAARMMASELHAQHNLPYTHPLYQPLTNMRYGSYENAPTDLTRLNRPELAQYNSGVTQVLYQTLVSRCESMAPVALLLQKLDALSELTI